MVAVSTAGRSRRIHAVTNPAGAMPAGTQMRVSIQDVPTNPHLATSGTPSVAHERPRERWRRGPWFHVKAGPGACSIPASAPVAAARSIEMRPARGEVRTVLAEPRRPRGSASARAARPDEQSDRQPQQHGATATAWKHHPTFAGWDVVCKHRQELSGGISLRPRGGRSCARFQCRAATISAWRTAPLAAVPDNLGSAATSRRTAPLV
jgi:hypothetical protein